MSKRILNSQIKSVFEFINFSDSCSDVRSPELVGAELLNPGVPEFDGALDEFIIDVQGVSNLLKQFFFSFVEITVDGGDID